MQIDLNDKIRNIKIYVPYMYSRKEFLKLTQRFFPTSTWFNIMMII